MHIINEKYLLSLFKTEQFFHGKANNMATACEANLCRVYACAWMPPYSLLDMPDHVTEGKQILNSYWSMLKTGIISALRN